MNRSLERIFHEVRESMSMALIAIRTNRLRSVLTLMGIAVGVFSIIAVMTAMGVLVSSIENGLSQLGANTFQIQRAPMFRSNDPKERPLTWSIHRPLERCRTDGRMNAR